MVQVCIVCRNMINTDAEDYCRITDYNKGAFYMEGYYHTKCFQERLKGSKALQSMAASVLHKANSMMDNLGLTNDDGGKKVIEIK